VILNCKDIDQMYSKHLKCKIDFIDRQHKIFPYTSILAVFME